MVMVEAMVPAFVWESISRNDECDGTEMGISIGYILAPLKERSTRGKKGFRKITAAS